MAVRGPVWWHFWRVGAVGAPAVDQDDHNEDTRRVAGWRPALDTDRGVSATDWLHDIVGTCLGT
jgi:hypothetical protein